MMNAKLKKLSRLISLAAAGGMLVSSPTYAQQGAGMLEEIIVTTTKRATSLQDVPVSVGVVMGEFINKMEIKDLGDFQSYVPGLQVQKTFGSWAVRVRGLGSGITNLAFDSSVPVFNDGVYCARGKCLESAFLDVERIEVARGPQGALFGKSTMAGAISVISAKPGDELEGYMKAGYELEYGGYQLNGAISAPLSDNFGARIAFNYEDTDGWVENPFTNDDDGAEDKYAIRASFAWDVSDATQVSLKLETGESETDGRSNQLVSPGIMSAISSDPAPEFEANDVRRVSTGVGQEDYYNHDWSLATLTLDQQLGEHTLTGILSYWETETAWRLDVDGSPDYLLNTDLRDEYEQTTAEIRLLSPTDQTFEYIAGLWYQQSDLSTQQFSPFSPALANFFGGVILGVPPFLLPPAATGGVGADRHISRDQDAFSAYAQLTWNVSDRFRVIADVRYTDETQDAIAEGFSSTFPDGVNPVHSGREYLFHFADYRLIQSREDDSLDPAIRFQFDATDNIMVYAGWSQGSKAGGLKANDQNIGQYTLDACADPVWCQQFAGQATLTEQQLAAGVTLQDGNGTLDYEDEEGDSFEIGAKMTLLDGRASLNVALYQMGFDNLQTSSYDGTRFIINNASSVDVDGFELEGSLQVIDNLRLNAAVAWVDATYDDFNQAQCTVDANGDQVDPACVDGAQDLSGERLERVPEWEANFNADWASNITDDLEFLASLSVYYSGDYFVRQDFSPLGRQESFTKWDLRLALGGTDGNWEVGATFRNIGDEHTIQHAYEILGDDFVSLSRGRTMTLDATFRF